MTEFEYKFETLACSLADHVLHVELAAPERLNRMSRKFFAEIRTAFERADVDIRVRVVVLSARGRVFTAGLDLAESGLFFCFVLFCFVLDLI